MGRGKKKVKVMEIETSRVTGREWKDRGERKEEEKELEVCIIDFLLISDESRLSKHLISELIQLIHLYAVVIPKT